MSSGKYCCRRKSRIFNRIHCTVNRDQGPHDAYTDHKNDNKIRCGTLCSIKLPQKHILVPGKRGSTDMVISDIIMQNYEFLLCDI